MNGSPPPAGRRLSIDARREQLVALGIRLFCERPYDEISTEEIAQRAGISKGLLYHYFPTKHAFYAEAVREMARQLLVAIAPNPDLPLGPALRSALRALVEFLSVNAGLYRGLMRGGVGLDPQVLGIVEAARQTTVERLAAMLGIGAPDPTARILLKGFIGFTEAACLDWLDRRDLDPEKLIALLVASFEPVRRALVRQTQKKGRSR